MKKTLLLLILFLPLLMMAQNITDRVVYLWDVTYSMHGGKFGQHYPPRFKYIGGKETKIVEYNEKYDIYNEVMMALVEDIKKQDENTEIVVIPFNDKVCEVWRYQATTSNKEILVNTIKAYRNVAQTHTSIYSALDYTQKNIFIPNDPVANRVKILTDGEEYRYTKQLLYDLLENYCDYAEKHNIKSSYYFLLSDVIQNRDPELVNLLKGMECMTVSDNIADIVVVPEVYPTYEIQNKKNISLTNGYEQPIKLEFKPIDDKLLLDGTAKIEVKIMDGDACLSMYKNIYVDKNTRELSLQPNWDISQESLMQELPVSGETEVVIYYEVLDGKLILSNKSTKIIIKNDRKLRKMTLKLQ